MIINNDLYINEEKSLLDDVEIEEVIDDDEYKYNIKINFITKTSINNISDKIIDEITYFLSLEQENGKIENFLKPQISLTENDNNIIISFSSSSYNVDDLNNIISKILIHFVNRTKLSSFVITNEIGRIYCEIFSTATDKSAFFIDENFYNFFKQYDNRLQDNDIKKSLIRSLIKYNITYPLDEKNNLYAFLTTSVSDFKSYKEYREKYITTYIVKADGSFLSNDAFKSCSHYKFGHSCVCKKDDELYNFIDTKGNYMFEEWYKNAESFNRYGYSYVQYLEGTEYKTKIIDSNGNFISDESFLTCELEDMTEDILVVCRLNNYLNYLDLKTGKLISQKQDFQNAFSFSDGYGTVVTKSQRYGFIDRQGNYKELDNEIEYLANFHEGVASVKIHSNRKLNSTYNYIKPDCTFLLPESISKYCTNCEEFKNGFGKIELNFNGSAKVYNYVDKDGNLLKPDRYFVFAGPFSADGLAAVKLSTYKNNYIKADGSFLLSENNDYNHCGQFINGFASVRNINEKYNFIKTDGTLISDKWFDNIGDFIEGFAIVTNSKDKNHINTEEDTIGGNYINTEGTIISKEWFDTTSSFKNGYAKVKRKESMKWNFIDKLGNMISKIDFDGANAFDKDGYARVKMGFQTFTINTKGELVSFI